MPGAAFILSYLTPFFQEMDQTSGSWVRVLLLEGKEFLEKFQHSVFCNCIHWVWDTRATSRISLFSCADFSVQFSFKVKRCGSPRVFMNQPGLVRESVTRSPAEDAVAVFFHFRKGDQSGVPKWLSPTSSFLIRSENNVHLSNLLLMRRCVKDAVCQEWYNNSSSGVTLDERDVMRSCLLERVWGRVAPRHCGGHVCSWRSGIGRGDPCYCPAAMRKLHWGISNWLDIAAISFPMGWQKTIRTWIPCEVEGLLGPSGSLKQVDALESGELTGHRQPPQRPVGQKLFALF